MTFLQPSLAGLLRAPMPAKSDMMSAYLSLGSNLGNRLANLQTCIQRLTELGDITGASSFYETEPVDVPDQPWFLNCIVELTTTLSPHQFLAGIQKIEADLGRNRAVAKGPRTVDIDIVLFGAVIASDSSLQIPHPAMHLRKFVLVPLVEVAPEILHPVLEKTARELLLALGLEGPAVRRLSE